ncbi:43768_t:CDS:2, partial [Gigaspora margarita]
EASLKSLANSYYLNQVKGCVSELQLELFRILILAQLVTECFFL